MLSVLCLEFLVTTFFSYKYSGQRGLVAFFSVWLCLSLTVWVSLCCFQGRLIVYSTSVERWRKKQLCFVRRVRLHSNHGLLLRLHGKSATRPLNTDPRPILPRPDRSIWVRRAMGSPCLVLCILDFWMMKSMKIWEVWNLDSLLLWDSIRFSVWNIWTFSMWFFLQVFESESGAL